MNNQSKRCWERQGNNNNTTEKQSNTTQLAQNSHWKKSFFWLPRVGFKPTTISSPGNALTNWATEAAQLAGLESCIQITQHLNLIHRWTQTDTMYIYHILHATLIFLIGPLLCVGGLAPLMQVCQVHVHSLSNTHASGYHSTTAIDHTPTIMGGATHTYTYRQILTICSSLTWGT